MLKRVVFIFVIILFVSNIYSFAQEIGVTKSGYFAAVTEKDFDKAVELFVQKDFVALNKLMKTKRVFPLKGGIKVYVVEGGIFSGKMKIRPAGSTREVWTFREAIGLQ